MARIKFYFDNRHKTDNNKYQIKLVITHRGTSALIPTGIYINESEWEYGDKDIDPHIKKTCKASKLYNNTLTSMFDKVDSIINMLVQNNSLYFFTSANKLKNYIVEIIQGKDTSFINYFKYAIDKKTTQGTKNAYKETLKKVLTFANGRDVQFQDINVKWLFDFGESLTTCSVNSKAIHFRQIRSVYNQAINEDIISQNNYPFRKFKIKREQTKKRSLTIDEIRQILSYNDNKTICKYRDMFMLSFYLCGINFVDMLNLKTIENGRIEYRRAKTHKLYSIKVEPEALEIINRYKGDKYLIFPLDTNKDYRTFALKTNKYLKKIMPKLSTYWARHTWATIAAGLDITKETISAALGHDLGSATTAIYINFDIKKIDAANRRVIDYINSEL